MARAFIMWMVRRTEWFQVHPLTPHVSEIRPMQRLAKRYAPFLRDEIQTGGNTIYRPLPWWAPCNALLHQWAAHDDGNEFHDHPRWSITICLKGELVEKTPWGERVLRPGGIVFRSPRYIHGFRVSPAHACRTWTLFIVGRRRRPQNTYVVTRRIEAAIRAKVDTRPQGRDAQQARFTSGAVRAAHSPTPYHHRRPNPMTGEHLARMDTGGAGQAGWNTTDRLHTQARTCDLCMAAASGAVIAALIIWSVW